MINPNTPTIAPATMISASTNTAATARSAVTMPATIHAPRLNRATRSGFRQPHFGHGTTQTKRRPSPVRSFRRHFPASNAAAWPSIPDGIGLGLTGACGRDFDGSERTLAASKIGAGDMGAVGGVDDFPWCDCPACGGPSSQTASACTRLRLASSNTPPNGEKTLRTSLGGQRGYPRFRPQSALVLLTVTRPALRFPERRGLLSPPLELLCDALGAFLLLVGASLSCAEAPLRRVGVPLWLVRDPLPRGGDSL